MNNLPLYITAFTMGLISSLHCVVMCGPLSFALPVGNLKARGKSIAFLNYNFGRVVTYSILGMIIGIGGNSARFFGWQQVLSIVTGVTLLIMLFQKYFLRPGTRSIFSSGRYTVISRLVWKCSQIKGNAGFFLFGIANGLLPCGMVYFALITALNAESMMQSVIFMFIFGTGTLPAMLALNITSPRIGVGSRLWMKKLIPWFISFVALLLIVRGMNLGLPFLSPLQNTSSSQAISCDP
jgi:sulfite exporter TauE/SafE